MNADFLISSLERFPKVIKSLVEELDESTWRFKPNADDWSILEVVCHLRDEEVEDFRYRVRSTLETPQQEWPPIDPPQTAIERKYQEDDPQGALESFLTERTDSLTWLHSLDSPDWGICHTHPRIGPVPAGRLLGSWAAHDLLHLRQITKRLFESSQQAAEHSLDYAGDW